ncbi:hypothetical protein EVAR_24565_1 [Eumeta japonica]|uniref:Uncharacterized protein n=1 Tax=Eumeta variegata TaxID=151549 RepID=A0A4C1W499_EUMVA|nr:hypothetical protein EVAR_24565_1 [Eumeta japonica]
MKILFKDDKDVEECFDRPMGPPPKRAQDASGPTPPPPCDMETCVAQKMGYLNEDGSIDKETLKSSVESKFVDNPTLGGKIIEKCIEGNLDQYQLIFAKPTNCYIVSFFSLSEDSTVYFVKSWLMPAKSFSKQYNPMSTLNEMC